MVEIRKAAAMIDFWRRLEPKLQADVLAGRHDDLPGLRRLREIVLAELDAAELWKAFDLQTRCGLYAGKLEHQPELLRVLREIQCRSAEAFVRTEIALGNYLTIQ